VNSTNSDTVGSFPRPAEESGALSKIFVDDHHKSKYIGMKSVSYRSVYSLTLSLLALMYESSSHIYVCQFSAEAPQVTLYVSQKQL